MPIYNHAGTLTACYRREDWHTEAMSTPTDLNIAVATVAGLVGLTIGSFGGVVADRVPIGASIVRPPSHCDACDAPLRPADNVPILSYLVLRGRCRVCGTHIPPKVLLIELVTGVLFAAVAARIGPVAALPAFLVGVAALVVLSAIDIEHRRLPSAIIYIAGGLGAALLLVAAGPGSHWLQLLHSLIGAVACFGGFFLIWFAVPRGMGFGDVRLSALCGMYLGWMGLAVIPIGIFAGFLLAGLPAIGLMIAGKATRKSQIPFGPYMAAGTVLAMLFGPTIAHAWLAL